MCVERGRGLDTLGSRGSVLILLMVVMSVVGGASYMLMEKDANNTLVLKKDQFRSDVKRTMNEIAIVLSNPDNCIATFGTSTTPTEVTVSSSSNKIFVVDFAIKDSRLNIVSYNLDTSSDPAILIVKFKNLNIDKRKSGINVIQRNISVKVKTAAGSMISCQTVEDSDASQWSRASSFTDIYYQPGHVSIGTKDPFSGTALNIKGSVIVGGDVYAHEFSNSSDRRLKRSISVIEDPLFFIARLKGVSYQWIESGKADIGLIAQDVQELIPEIVNYNKQRDQYSLAYGKLVPFLVEAMKVQQQELDRITAAVAQLEKQ